MNLKELLNFRSKCLIHKTWLKPHCSKQPLRNDKIKLFEQGLSLCSKSKWDTYDNPSLTGLNFRFDGTFNKNSACPKWIIDDTLVVYMACDVCACQPILSEKDPTVTTPMNIKQNSYYYSFALSGQPDGTYIGGGGWETIKYTLDETFYHIDVNLLNNEAKCRMGSCDTRKSVDAMAASTISLTVPNFNLDNFKSTEQLVSKMKLYSLFS